MILACRDKISKVDRSKGSNAKLLLDKYLREQNEGTNRSEDREYLLKAAIEAVKQNDLMNLYDKAFKRYKGSLLEPMKGDFFETKGRIAIGLGGESVLETDLTLHHTYGVPILPGSGLKGLASHYCERVWGFRHNHDEDEGEDFHKVLFGNTKDSGHIIFHDAWITPESLAGSLVLDIMTPHHMEYYSGKMSSCGIVAPTDFDNPNPVSFLSVTGKFYLAVSCDVTSDEGSDWADLAFNLLSEALMNWGIGGKTNAGYGKLEISKGLCLI